MTNSLLVMQRSPYELGYIEWGSNNILRAVLNFTGELKSLFLLNDSPKEDASKKDNEKKNMISINRLGLVGAGILYALLELLYSFIFNGIYLIELKANKFLDETVGSIQFFEPFYKWIVVFLSFIILSARAAISVFTLDIWRRSILLIHSKSKYIMRDTVMFFATIFVSNIAGGWLYNNIMLVLNHLEIAANYRNIISIIVSVYMSLLVYNIFRNTSKKISYYNIFIILHWCIVGLLYFASLICKTNPNAKVFPWSSSYYN
ncbi:hypothetical protein NEPAR06_1592 [Nematocida parisii]|uniref:Uncharacterized protein n=1 Tax=Nematocida parisii (strain ERTm3) TaxID=935791 RepID=I3EJB9_NEMP3|nr:uncharacterized protein NEPG_02553 [Nematocida parisii ERTm1]EIJ89316.1 hypothetical protein NEQG_00086 [Nematocida parisii ERTm3]KAI5142549.1 hypothetical protein NEPAR07_0154 [Nematocida parisii]EIJ92665.1 hypothetical protein NEPG_02553 [Nematocida parisii ERTm1]KAI5155164.1 hypothetical protein NEPAR06_1592 [Nematocida parisii]KAI5155869.1 hypothetical protein NEPAR05_0118 [Nematocida parisii]|eukprot:XP_013060380.1 hypothetical protein NEPG_02553 [Nematocida parisii ERTm1]